MGFNWWNHRRTYTVNVPMSVSDAMQHLRAHFDTPSHKRAKFEPELGVLQVKRGSVWCSLFVPGPETWCRHTIDIVVTSAGESGVSIQFDILMNAFGFTVGKNAIVEECRKLGRTLQRTAY